MKDYTGKKYGNLTLLKYSRPGGNGVGAYWLCRCDCGNLLETIARNVTAGRTKTCGKCEYNRNLIRKRRGSKDRAGTLIRRKYSQYVRRSVMREAKWDLNPEEFQRIIKEDCFYCGTAPGKDGNQVDIVRPDLGYTLENSVPCCPQCLRWRGAGKVEEFLEHAIKIANHFKSPIDK